jgi:hypothetical protein
MTERKWYQAMYDGEPDNSPWGRLWLLEDSRKVYLDRVMRGTPGEQFSLVPVDKPEGASLAEQVKAYARGHYDTGGWDVVVECWEDEQLAEVTDGCATLDDVFAGTLGACVSVWADQEADARNSAF